MLDKESTEVKHYNYAINILYKVRNICGPVSMQKEKMILLKVSPSNRYKTKLALIQKLKNVKYYSPDNINVDYIITKIK